MTHPTSEGRPNQSGSVILREWNATRQAMKAQTGAVPVSEITRGTEAFGWITGMAGPGRAVTERSAMSVAAVYACVSLIGGAIASLVMGEYERNGADNMPVQSDLWYLFNEEMHPRWSAAVGWEYGVQSLLLHGDLFQRIHRVTRYSSAIESFEPLHPLCVNPMRYGERMVYSVWDPVTGQVEYIDQDDIIHVPGPGFDGYRGLSQIRHVLRLPVSASIAAGELSEGILNDGLRPDLVLKTSTKLDEAKINKLRNQWLEKYSGLRNSAAPVVLDGDMDIKQISMSASDAQLLENRKLTADDICGIFGVMPYMIGRPEKTTTLGSSVEQFGISFVKYTLQRHIVKIEQEANRKVIRSPTKFVRYDVSSLERGDTSARFTAYRTAAGRAGEPGFMTVNEIRRKENLPPVPDGDQLFKGTNDAAKPNPPAAE
ncbi:phage portal protein [Paraburkholderia saeva]|uniref:Phage portal protein n=1 Tax=Paraburkholderia saeva TaxID=2777537 RepID=A0A9N8RYE3_9BURK|nr:phage portal protein [Paraburkholderia saeva]CAG4906170.1 hypothetical protein LMG31841_03531 [Paraburkholderia saeva]